MLSLERTMLMETVILQALADHTAADIHTAAWAEHPWHQVVVPWRKLHPGEIPPWKRLVAGAAACGDPMLKQVVPGRLHLVERIPCAIPIPWSSALLSGGMEEWRGRDGGEKSLIISPSLLLIGMKIQLFCPCWRNPYKARQRQWEHCQACSPPTMWARTTDKLHENN